MLPLFASGTVSVWLWPRGPSGDALTEREQAFLDRSAFSASRRAEWRRARGAAHQVLPAGASVLTTSSGAPRLIGAPGLSISLSHEGAAVAVAVRRGGAVAVDLARRAHARRLGAIFARLAPRGRAVRDPVAAWVALECALKLRRLSVYSIVDRLIGLHQRGRCVRVAGFGATVRAHILEPVGGLVLGVAW